MRYCPRTLRTIWLALAVFAIGVCLTVTSRGAPTTSPKEPGNDIARKEIDEIAFEDLRMDNGFVGPITPGIDHLDDERKQKLNEWLAKVADWEPGQLEKAGSIGQRVRNLLSLCAMADLGRGEFEGETAFVLFDMLRKDTPKDKLAQAAAWVALRPSEGTVVKSAAELGMEGEVPEEQLRERTALYAAKLLGRALGKIPWKEGEKVEEPVAPPATQATSGPTTRPVVAPGVNAK